MHRYEFVSMKFGIQTCMYKPGFHILYKIQFVQQGCSGYAKPKRPL